LKSFLFPDVNVWLDFVYAGHIHHRRAFEWFTSLEDTDRACLSRFTQVSLLRLLTTEAVMRQDTMTQRQAWSMYDKLFDDGRVILLDEPIAIEPLFRTLTQSAHASSKQWADAYLLAFAKAANITFVTFDRALRAHTPNMILLKP
jgi:uncharacterized protein